MKHKIINTIMTNLKHSLGLIVGVCFCISAYAQNQITLEDIWTKGTFGTRGVSGFNSMNDGRFYTAVDKEENIVKYRFASGDEVETVVKQSLHGLKQFSYSFSDDENKVLFQTNFKQLYRHSYAANIHVLDLTTRKLIQPISDPVMLPEFSPDGTKLAYVRGNNLYWYDLIEQREIQITTDGKQNNIINGATDWVYEEEFALSKGFYWNSNSTQIAYYRFDESGVKEFTMAMYGSLYPDQYTFKYPKAGESNSVIDIYVFDVSTGKKQAIDIGVEKDIYIPRLHWTTNSNTLMVQRLNRLQNKLELLLANTSNGQSTIIYTEENKAYIEVPEVYFLPDGKTFILNSEKSGNNHLYQYQLNGTLIRQVTKGNWDVDQVYGISSNSKWIYASTSEVSSTERYVYALSIDGKTKKQLTTMKGWNSAIFNKDYSYFLWSHSSINSPPLYALCDATGKTIRVLEENKHATDKMKQFNIEPAVITTFNNSYQESLNAFIFRPHHFDSTKKYPVLMYVYGGPGHQLAVNRWMGAYYFWYQMLAEQGYMIVCVDGRGTGFKGESFKKVTYLQLGKYEIEDQIYVAKQLAKLPYVDASRIGIWGWSFGGYMASLGITKGADVFKTAIAVAPVTNWRYYDNIYTERFMRTPSENGKNYDDNSPINHVSKIKGNYLIIRGTADDNVHFQNAVEMINKMINKGVKFDSELYPDKNHGIGGASTRLHLFERMTSFIKEKL